MPTLPVAPLLCGEPGDRLADVRCSCGVILVERDPLGGARAAEVEPADREAALVAEALVLGRRTTT